MGRARIVLAAWCALTLLACSGDTAGPSSGGALGIRVQPSGAQVGVALKVQPVIEILDAKGKKATGSNAQVTVHLVEGGTVKGTTTVSATAGVATFTDLELGGTAGPRTLSFTSPGLADATSAQIQLTPGAPKGLALTVPPNAAAQTMIPLETQPVAQAVDADGNAVPFAATVTASIVAGNGIVAAGATTATNAAGSAVFNGLTLGALNTMVGGVTLQFSAPGLNPASIAITLSCSMRSAPLNTTVIGALGTGDCIFGGGNYVHKYALEAANAAAYNVTMDGAFRTRVFVRGPNETRLYWGFDSGSASNRMSYGILVPRGRSEVAAMPYSAATSGAYSIRFDSRSSDVGCSLVLAASPLVTDQRLSAATDCASGGYLGDFYAIGVPVGAAVIATATSGAFQPDLSLETDFGVEVAASVGNATSATLTYTNNTGSHQLLYLLVVNHTPNQSGAYNLDLVINYPPGFTQEGPAVIPVPNDAPTADGLKRMLER